MSTYEISKSSLVSLKAEILRKRQELHKAKAENDVKIRTIKKNTPLEIKNKGVDERKDNDLTAEEEDLLKKSKSVLEAKAQLYDRLLNSTKKLSHAEREHNKRYLVRFDKKKSKVSDLPPSDSDEEADIDRYPGSDEERHFSDDYDAAGDPSEEWVEYVDCLGRTRKCLRKDLEHIKANDADLKETVAAKDRNNEPQSKPPEISNLAEPEPELSDIENRDENGIEDELMSSDMRRELQRQQWEKEEDQLQNKDNIHYQDILFSEARTHGVGYYGFSKDEEERHKQQEALKKLREETEQQQKKSQELKMMREKQLAARVKAARNRKRARMGLPPEEDDIPSNIPEEPSVDKEKEEQEQEAKKKEEAEKERLLEEARRKYLRPWDVGKEGVKEHYEYTQEEWVHKKRRERPEEFAPPSSSRKDFRSVEKSFDNSCGLDKSLKFTTKKAVTARKFDDKYQIQPNRYFENIVQSAPQEPIPIVDECEENGIDDRLLADYGKAMENTELIRERYSSFSSTEETDFNRAKGVEVAPPPTFDYYGPSSSKKSKGSVPLSNIEQSIEAGLQFLRKQVEKKNSSSRHAEDMY